jgi:iron(III) transport system ATP-binding protein
MLTIRNISKSFDTKQILKGIDLEINQGEIISILGQSGSGKSTILNLISGFEELDKGEVIYKKKTLSSTNTFIEAQKRDIGFVFQNYALFPHLNVKQNILFGIDKKSKSTQTQILYEMIELLDLQGQEDKYPHQLSGGQQQRVAIARSIAKGSDLILFDEVFSSIDSILKLRIITQIKKILKQRKITAIFVTHSPREAVMLSDKIAYIEEGKILQYDTPKNLNCFPVSQSVSNLFGDNSFIFSKIQFY